MRANQHGERRADASNRRRAGTPQKYYTRTSQPSGTGCYCQISGWDICARLHPADSYVPAYVGKSFEKYHSAEQQGHDPDCACDGHYCCLHVISLCRKRSYSSMLSSAKEKPGKFSRICCSLPNSAIADFRHRSDLRGCEAGGCRGEVSARIWQNNRMDTSDGRLSAEIPACLI
jgi:hypothetical protein